MENNFNNESILARIENLEYLTRYEKTTFDSCIPIHKRVEFLQKAEKEAFNIGLIFEGKHELEEINGKLAIRAIYIDEDSVETKGLIFLVEKRGRDEKNYGPKHLYP